MLRKMVYGKSAVSEFKTYANGKGADYLEQSKNPGTANSESVLSGAKSRNRTRSATVWPARRSRSRTFSIASRWRLCVRYGHWGMHAGLPVADTATQVFAGRDGWVAYGWRLPPVTASSW